jgi:dienelactone hydrolase
LLIHGHNSYHEVPLLNCGAAFASAGYAVYSFDFCGTNPVNSKSDSSEASISAYNDRSAHSCEADMEEILAWIYSLDYIDSEAFFVYGESRGGGLAAELTARKADRVKGAVLMYPGVIEEDLSAITIKMLAFQGTADKIVSPEGTKELVAKYPNIVLTEIDGGGHGGFTAQQYRDVQNLILDYFAECRGLDPASRAQIVTD